MFTVTEFNADWTETISHPITLDDARAQALARSRYEYVDHVTVTDSTKLKPYVYKGGKEL